MYRSTWRYTDFTSTDRAVIAGQWAEIGEYQVESGVGYSPGFGYSNSQSDADGRVFAMFADNNGDEIKGFLRIVAYTPDDLPIRVLFEARTESLNTSETDRTKQIPFPMMSIRLWKDYKFKLFFKADASATIDHDNAKTVMLMDITKTSKAFS